MVNDAPDQTPNNRPAEGVRNDAPPKKKQDRERVLVGPVWADLTHYRKCRNENQETFWGRFGVTQSAGSRYEKDARQIPQSVLMLVIALALSVVSEDQLERLKIATKNVETTN